MYLLKHALGCYLLIFLLIYLSISSTNLHIQYVLPCSFSDDWGHLNSTIYRHAFACSYLWYLNVTYLIDFLFVVQFHCKISQHKMQSHIKIGISFHAHRSAVQLRWLHFRLYICGSARAVLLPVCSLWSPDKTISNDPICQIFVTAPYLCSTLQQRSLKDQSIIGLANHENKKSTVKIVM